MTIHDMERVAAETYNGKLPTYTMMGSYPLVYLTEQGNVLCANCANEELERWQQGESDDPPSDYGPYDEGPPLGCDECSTQIESAYGDPEENDG